MTSKKQDKTTEGKSVGFLNALEKMHIAVGDIPLDMMADLGLFEDQVGKAKDWNRKFVADMYDRIEAAASAPGKLFGAIRGKVKGTAKAATPAKQAKPKAVARQAKPKAAAKPKAKAKAPKAKAKAPKAKAKAPKAKAKATTARAKPKTATRAKPKTARRRAPVKKAA